MKVLIGCPTADTHKYCVEEYINSVQAINYANKRIVLIDNSKNDDYCYFLKNLGVDVIKTLYCESARERIVKSRNILREMVINENYDYFLSLEQDVIPPREIIEKLISHNKDIVSGIYFSRIKSVKDKTVNVLPLIWSGNLINEYSMSDIDINRVMGNNFLEIKYCGLGCVLISKAVLSKIKFRFDSNYPSFDDLHFCFDARQHGFKIYADTSIKCKHLVLKRDWFWDDNKDIQRFKKDI